MPESHGYAAKWWTHGQALYGWCGGGIEAELVRWMLVTFTGFWFVKTETPNMTIRTLQDSHLLPAQAARSLLWGLNVVGVIQTTLWTRLILVSNKTMNHSRVAYLSRLEALMLLCWIVATDCMFALKCGHGLARSYTFNNINMCLSKFMTCFSWRRQPQQ